MLKNTRTPSELTTLWTQRPSQTDMFLQLPHHTPNQQRTLSHITQKTSKTWNLQCHNPRWTRSLRTSRASTRKKTWRTWVSLRSKRRFSSRWTGSRRKTQRTSLLDKMRLLNQGSSSMSRCKSLNYLLINKRKPMIELNNWQLLLTTSSFNLSSRESHQAKGWALTNLQRCSRNLTDT